METIEPSIDDILAKLRRSVNEEKARQMPDKQVQALFEQFDELAADNNWQALGEATEKVYGDPAVHYVLHRVMRYRAMAAEQLGNWSLAASSWQFVISYDGASDDEAPLLLSRAIICLIKAGELDEAEKLLYDEQLEWPDGDFSTAYAAFHQLGYRLCFHKPEHERLPTLLELLDGSDTELDQARDWSNSLMRLKRRCIADIIRRLYANEFILLYEYCRNPALEQYFAQIMSQRCALYIQRDRIWYRCKLDGPCFTLAHARHLKRKIERLARVSSRMHADEEDYPDDIEWGAIHRLA